MAQVVTWFLASVIVVETAKLNKTHFLITRYLLLFKISFQNKIKDRKQKSPFLTASLLD